MCVKRKSLLIYSEQTCKLIALVAGTVNSINMKVKIKETYLYKTKEQLRIQTLRPYHIVHRIACDAYYGAASLPSADEQREREKGKRKRERVERVRE